MKTLYALGFVGFAALSVRAQATLYAQCELSGYPHSSPCVLTIFNRWRQGKLSISCLLIRNESSQDWAGPTTCVSGAVCQYENDCKLTLLR